MSENQPQWNGQPCGALKVKVIVADAPEVPMYWARGFIGQERAAVQVTYEGKTFYLDNEDGSGWNKVMNGGSPRFLHRDLRIERITESGGIRL